jgi:hypothetical protein
MLVSFSLGNAISEEKYSICSRFHRQQQQQAFYYCFLASVKHKLILLVNLSGISNRPIIIEVK